MMCCPTSVVYRKSLLAESPRLARSRLQVQELRKRGQQGSNGFSEEGKERRNRFTHFSLVTDNDGLPKTIYLGNTISASTDICL